jgi:hypothetical protein
MWIFRRLRSPWHATAVAYLALFMAMGGTAYAAVQWTGANIADGSLTGADVAPNSLTGASIQDGSLTGADISAGSISASDLAPGTVGSGGSPATALLGAGSNPASVTAPLYGTDSSATQIVTSVHFTVPAGHSYQVQLSAQAVTSQSGGSCQDQTGWLGGQLGLVADGDYSHNLMGYQSGNLPGGAIGGSQVVVFGAGDHTVVIANSPSVCGSVADPGVATIADSFLSVTLLATF